MEPRVEMTSQFIEADVDKAITANETPPTAYLSNSRVQQDILPQDVESLIEKAQSFHRASNDSAVDAIAHCYMVWWDTCRPGANKQLSTWMKNKIEERDNEIELSNKRISKKTASGTATAASHRLTRLKARLGTSKFTVIVKYVFDFVKPADASMVSRYSKVMDWLDTQVGNKVIESPKELSKIINDGGNIETIIRSQRGHGPTISSEARRNIAAAITQNAKTAFEEADTVGSVDITLECQESFVALIGRYTDGKVDVVGSCVIEERELQEWVSRFADDITLEVNDTTEFIARVLSLGRLVSEGSVTQHTRHGTATGEHLLQERVLTLLPSGSEGPAVVVSARHTEASVIIKVHPNNTRVALESVTEPMMLDGESRAKLQNQLSDRGLCSLITIRQVREASGFAWIAKNSALSLAQGAETRVNWKPVAREERKPIDVEGFNARFTVVVSREVLEGFYLDSLKEWENSQESKAKEKTKLATLKFEGGKVEYNCDGQEPQTLSVSGIIRRSILMPFRPRDLVHLVAKLISLRSVAQFTFSGDPDGMLQVSWTDGLGEYTICQPTAGSDGRLIYRRIAQLRAEEPVTDDDQGDETAA